MRAILIAVGTILLLVVEAEAGRRGYGGGRSRGGGYGGGGLTGLFATIFGLIAMFVAWIAFCLALGSVVWVWEKVKEFFRGY